MGLISHYNFSKEKSPNRWTIINTVKKAMKTAGFRRSLKGRRLFIKPNLLSFTPVPGQCTSPWVVEGVLRVLSDAGYEMAIGDANVATRAQVEKAATNWGTKSLSKEFNARFVNLTKEKTKTFDLHGEVFQKMAIPEILVKSDAIITLPVLKMHIVTGMTFSLKNQWGCLTTVRQKYHLVADKCIPEINKFLNVAFAVGDATICMEGNGPVTGKPVRVDSVLASSDRVSLDSAGCEIMGVNPRKIGHIVHAEKIGLGSIDYKLKGDRLPRHRFRKPVLSQQPIVNIEFKLRKIPGVSWLVFDTPFFKLPAFAASRYNTVYWHNLHGRKLTKEFLEKNLLYREEFNELRPRIRSS